jgi:hypothetical protein
VTSTRFLAAACLLAPLAAAALAEEPSMFRGSAWVCDSPEHYDVAIERERAGGESRALRRELAQICVFIADDDQDEIMAPFVRRLEDNGDKVKVVFMIQVERRKALLNRSVEQIQYRGWTAASKLQTRTDWLKIRN